MALASDIIAIDQGTTWSAAWAYAQSSVAADGTEGAPVAPDWAGWSGRSQVRARYGAAAPLVTWSSDPDDTTADGWVTLNPGGVVVLSLQPQVSALWTWNRFGACPWDVELTAPDGGVIRLLEGTATLRPDATR